ncbi:MAG: hypothetical protein V3V60_15980 [Sphingomonas aquatilis]|uniref:hypothetical protein n=1 Tax=Sphingomonas aquatilis TaxID=93063 RepID=UPI002F2EFF51
MFVMQDNPTFNATARGKMPGEDGEDFSFKARFEALSQSEQEAFDLSTADGTIAFLKRTFVGASDVLGADEQPVPFTDATRDWMIDRIHTRGALVKAYFAEVYGAQLGN